MKLPQRIELVPADAPALNDMATQYHYMHRPVHRKARPFGWTVRFDGNSHIADGKPAGFVMFASVHFTRLTGVFGYPGLPTKWQTLSLARLWLHDELPRNSETVVIAKTLRLVQARWLEVHPPRWLDQPYHVRVILSYADTRYHNGTIYRAANFEENGRTISQKRHRNTRGEGLEGAELIRFVYRLPEPRWKYEPAQLPMQFCTNGAAH
jgi:hypothetical protein